ncbi:4'-phosphopantetheinyl transferase family protein [Bacillus thuringiensis]
MKIFLLELPEYLESTSEIFFLERVETEKKKQINKFIYKEDRYRSLLGDVLVRYACLTELAIDNKDIVFYKNNYGKPYLCKYEHFHFNISHSGKWVVCVVGDTPLGVDIEEITEIDLGITKFFSEWERDYINGGIGIGKRERFFDIWTLKESYIKAVGRGMSIELDSFTILYEGLEPKLITTCDSGQTKYFFKQYNLLPNYKLSVCTMSNIFPNELEYVDIPLLLKCLK